MTDPVPHYEDDDLEPFLSEVRDEAMPARWRLGSLLYLEARETFLSREHRDELSAAREDICRTLTAESDAGAMCGEVEPPPLPRVQGKLFATDRDP